RDPQTRITTGLQQGVLVAACRLDHDARVVHGAQPPHELADARRAVGVSRHARDPIDGDIQRRLAHVDAHCRHLDSPLELALSRASRPGPRLSVRELPRATVRAQGARSGVWPLLNYGAAYTEALSGAH